MPHLDEVLVGVVRIGIDTMTVIYYVEENPQYLPIVEKLFERIADAQLSGVASMITLLEVLRQPLRLGTRELAHQYRDLLTNSENFELFPLTAEFAETAADLRARYNLRTADAVVAATAILTNCQALITNDERLRRVTELQVIFLDEITV